MARKKVAENFTLRTGQRYRFGENHPGEDGDTEDARERLLEKDTIIDEQWKKIEEMNTELHEAKAKERKQDEEAKKMITAILEKEELIRKINAKISALSTKDMKNLKSKVVKK